MTKVLDFQSIIMALQNYWAQQGCLIWQPYYSQVGAGTMNPATFLRVLGPEPWNVAYVEPSVRPDDGRYGDNPNRLQTHYQFQVILKPDPGNPQELYLGSLVAIGIDPAKHDIRFVEDNWESPALGAWGLGWEVWLDGLEITQFTYFQQAGGMMLDPVSVELTYGLDRIAAPLQNAHGFQEIRWNDKLTFGDVNLQAEQEQSKYYFEVADVERMRAVYDLHAAETEAALEAGLILPAYDNLLKLSHTFNVLDTRGAIGVTERQAYFRGMRRLASKVAEQYVEGRQRLEFPWWDEDDQATTSAKEKPSKKTSSKSSTPTKPADFLLEIGTEELPPADLDTYMAQLEEKVPVLLEGLHLEHGPVKVFGTPRRLVVHVEQLSASQPDREEFAKGPPASRAFGAEGTPTKAAEGFARGKGVSVKDLQVQEIDGGEYVVAHVKETGRSSVEVLSEALPGLIVSLRVDRSMRWNTSQVAFSRPIRWLLALHGGHLIPFEYADLISSGATRGLRFTEPETIEVKDANDYFAQLEKQGIIMDGKARRAAIKKQVDTIAKKAGGQVPDDSGLLAEVTHLVEAPTALLGGFDEEFLTLPREVLIAVMKKHQRYFPLEKSGKLRPQFITVRNGGEENLDLVAKGNEEVVRARFADAAFFVEDDLKNPLRDYVPKLETLTFQKDLGSMLDKSKRVIELVSDIAPKMGLSKEETSTAIRAAELCKADLVTKMVVEMTSLQGVMGKHYAERSGEPAEVSLAIREHYMPVSSGDRIPESLPGLAVALADRLDSLASLFAAGLQPTGSKDPFALRRAALGLVQILIEKDLDFDLSAGLEMATKELPVKTSAGSQAEALAFISRRLNSLLRVQGFA
ncbi:MAG: glycine--tRNA ligase subunit beta, partial [Anaerolineae bacterium]|nr:glycine--tRNA ligase subunit beta [Anaerolineae bacterium]